MCIISNNILYVLNIFIHNKYVYITVKTVGVCNDMTDRLQGTHETDN